LDSLCPMNGFLAIPLLRFLPLHVVYNLLITFAFAGAGLTTFWLALEMTAAYWPSLAAGYAFTFSAFHFAHAPGHMHQFTIEFLPLFFLFWLRLIRRPTIWKAVLAALALFCVLLCDDYQFLFCAIAICLSMIWLFAHDRKAIDPRRLGIAFSVFILCAALSCGPLVIAKWLATHRGTYASMHFSAQNNVDLFNLFVPGFTWCFHRYTAAVWEPQGSYAETSISIGVAVFIAAIWGWIVRKRIEFETASLWLLLAVCFGALSLGITLRVMHVRVTDWMPYRLLENSIPALKFAAVPSRMELITQLACSILAAGGLKAIGNLRNSIRVPLLICFILAMVLESEPRLQATYPLRQVKWAEFLRDDPHPGAIVDLIARGGSEGLFFQTIHHRPTALGYVSRTPMRENNAGYLILWQAEHGQFDPLEKMGFKFIVTPTNENLDLPIAYEDAKSRVYLLENFSAP
ncbi:MAG TPA: hypothetical protein VKK61_10405, partial [Tepidisphaeraceae bacterium]|nr:hypothetical protein [Tepidisphaeraceae bacterium]